MAGGGEGGAGSGEQRGDSDWDISYERRIYL